MVYFENCKMVGCIRCWKYFHLDDQKDNKNTLIHMDRILRVKPLNGIAGYSESSNISIFCQKWMQC